MKKGDSSFITLSQNFSIKTAFRQWGKPLQKHNFQ
jgi:hypothetical protein